MFRVVLLVAAAAMTPSMAWADDVEFPHLPIYNNPYKTPEQEQGFAHSAELDWDSLTNKEKTKCVEVLILPAEPFDPSNVDLRNAPPNTYERLEMCTSMEITADAVTGHPDSWISPRTDIASVPRPND